VLKQFDFRALKKKFFLKIIYPQNSWTFLPSWCGARAARFKWWRELQRSLWAIKRCWQTVVCHLYWVCSERQKVFQKFWWLRNCHLILLEYMNETQLSASGMITVTNCKMRVRDVLLTPACAYAAQLYRVIVSW